MSDLAPMPEESLDRWLADQHRALVDDLALALDLEAGLREAMIPAQHAGLVADLRDVLDVEAGLNAIVPTTPDTAFEADPEPWRSEESTWSPGSVAVAVRRGAAARVFVSHAREDRALAGELYRRLVDDGHEVFLDQDLRDSVVVGKEWEQWLHERLRWADAMVCVVTSAYLASRRCTAEVGFAKSRGSWLLPVRAEPGLEDPLLSSVEDTDLVRDSVGAALVRTLRRVDDTGVLAWPEDRSPFPGLRPFDTDQHRVFFGRTDEAERLARLLQSSAKRAGSAALLVVGPSGCGKSSLVRAGLLPVMANKPGWWTLPPIVPGADPVAALARGLAIAAQQLDLDWTVEHVHRQLDERGIEELADELLLAAPGGPRRRLLLVVDQFEELLTQTGPTERARFAELLYSALTGPVQVVGTLRPEFLDQLLVDSELARLSTEIYPLRPLRGAALRTIIEGPARLAGISVDEHLVARLIDDAGSGEALPLLAFTLAQLADGINRGGQLSSARYEQLGGVQGALTRQADAALAEAIAAGGRLGEQVIDGLLRLVTVDEQGHPTRWRVVRDELPEPVAAELDVFVARRLLTTDTDNSRVVVGVAHEAFLSAWPPLAQAISAAASALRARRAIEHAATEWNDNGRPPTRLWGGGQLAAAVTDTGARIRASSTALSDRQGPSRWLRWRHHVLVTDHVGLSSSARDFLHASIRLDRYRRRRVITVLSVLFIATLVAAGTAVIQQRAAGEAQRIATARQLVAQAEVARNTDPRTALQLGLAAQRIYPDAETYSSLVNLVTNTRYSGTLTGHTGPVNFVAFSPDGHTLATASSDQTVRLWDVTNPTHPVLTATLVGHTDAVNSVAFSPDGHTLATASSDQTVRLWDVSDRDLPRQLGQPVTGHTDAVNSVAFAPNGRTLATASSDQTVRLWDVTDPTRPSQLGQPLTDHTNVVYDVVFAPDGRTLATTSSDRTVNLWDVVDPYRPALTASLFVHTDAVNSVAFSPDGHTLATASSDRSVKLWNVTDPRKPVPTAALTGHTSPVNSVAFSPDGHTLATASSDRSVKLWNLTDPRSPVLTTTLTGQDGVVRWVAFAADGHTLATGGDDATTILWNLTLNASRATERACSITGGGLNRDEWARYIPGLPYENTCPG